MAVVELTRPSRHVALVRMNRPDARNALNKDVRTLINGYFSGCNHRTTMTASAAQLLQNLPHTTSP
jgi:enoyl-CoA hydratase/carnithine racemase